MGWSPVVCVAGGRGTGLLSRRRRGERLSFSPRGHMAMEAINDRPPTMQNDYFASWFRLEPMPGGW
jgi:hypothetical protein